MDQGSNKNHSTAYNFTPTVTKFCVMWEGLPLPHDTKFGNCRCKIVDSRSFHSWSLIHGLRWSGLIKVGPGQGHGSLTCHMIWAIWLAEVSKFHQHRDRMIIYPMLTQYRHSVKWLQKPGYFQYEWISVPACLMIEKLNWCHSGDLTLFRLSSSWNYTLYT